MNQRFGKIAPHLVSRERLREADGRPPCLPPRPTLVALPTVRLDCGPHGMWTGTGCAHLIVPP